MSYLNPIYKEKETIEDLKQIDVDSFIKEIIEVSINEKKGSIDTAIKLTGGNYNKAKISDPLIIELLEKVATKEDVLISIRREALWCLKYRTDQNAKYQSSLKKIIKEDIKDEDKINLAFWSIRTICEGEPEDIEIIKELFSYLSFRSRLLLCDLVIEEIYYHVENDNKILEKCISLDYLQGITETIIQTELQLIIEILEKELLDFSYTHLPKFDLTLETPELFSNKPELEKMENFKDNIFKDKNGKIWKYFDIELLLGCYNSDAEKITLYLRGIKWCARSLGCKTSELHRIVLIHEIAHWIHHKFRFGSSEEWNVEYLKDTVDEVNEGLAQLMTYWVSKFISEEKKYNIEFIDVFSKLNTEQSNAYHVYEGFKEQNVTKIIYSLVYLRDLLKPAEYRDWERFF